MRVDFLDCGALTQPLSSKIVEVFMVSAAVNGVNLGDVGVFGAVFYVSAPGA
jgi:hypothetical protein